MATGPKHAHITIDYKDGFIQLQEITTSLT